jgi:hypothetical protein
MPITPLMFAVGSRNSPAVTRYRVNILLRMSGRGLHREIPHAGHPIGHHVAGFLPCTQIRLGAGTPHLPSAATHDQPKRGPHMS